MIIDIKDQIDWLPSKQKSAMASFAAEDPALRTGPSGDKAEEITNELQSSMVDIYDKWAKDAKTVILSAVNRGIEQDDLGTIVKGRLAELSTKLLASQKEGITGALNLFVNTALNPSTRIQGVTAVLLSQAAESMRTGLIPSIQERLSAKLSVAGTIDATHLDEIFNSARASVAASAGYAWAGIFLGLSAAGQDLEERTGVAQRVRWVLNPTAEHCAESEGHFGCPSQARVYDSWSELETVPAGQVTCRGNCRCRLEVEESPGSNVWVQGLPGFTP